MEIIEVIAKTIIDAVEDCIGAMTIAKGTRLLEVFGCTVGILGISLLCKLLELPEFINWKAALLAVGVACIITCSNEVSKSKLKTFKNRLNEGKRGKYGRVKEQ